jgi:sn-glycerol 3-phosphate transport system substrate-binding protein
MGPLRILASLLILAAAPAAGAAGTIELWHALGGTAAEELGHIAEGFNASQREYRVVPVLKGSYREVLDRGLAAQRSGHPPQILQVDESLTAIAEAWGRAFTPVYKVMEQAGQPSGAATFAPLVGDPSMDEHGRLVSWPFNASTPVLLYNRDTFKAAGLDPDRAPRTWLNVQEAALKVIDSGASTCGFTTESPTWVHLENLLARHNEPLAEVERGPRGTQPRLVFNTRLLVLLVGQLSSWISSGIFSYFGRRKEGEQKFAAGECAMLTGPSGSIADIERKSTFHLGVAALPVYDDVPAAPPAALPSGGSLWVMSGNRKSDYVGVAKFFAYLSRPEIQAHWHQATGYLPLTRAAFDLTRKQGFYQRHPEAEVSTRALPAAFAEPAHGKGKHYTPTTWLRWIVDEELEAVWDRRKTPKEALDDALTRGNGMIRMLPPSSRPR